MFTGIVERTGSVQRILRRGGGARLEVRAPEIVPQLGIGDSIAVNGACVTVTERSEDAFAADLVPETVARTNLGILEPNEEVNLERPVRAADRLGGHIVQGHVDAVGLVRSKRRVGAQEMLEVTIPFELARYLAPQGSVAVDGVSLTVVSVDRDRFKVALIPHTVDSTTLGRKGQGAAVNVEVDILSKYVERHMAMRAARPPLGSLFEEAREDESPPPPPRPSRPAPQPEPARASKRTPPQAPKPAARSAAKPARTAKTTKGASPRGSGRSQATEAARRAAKATAAKGTKSMRPRGRR